MNFLPPEYKVPTESRYMKFLEGTNTFRILGSFTNGSAIMGYEYWTTDDNKNRRPNRVKMGVSIPMENLEEDPRTGELQLPRHFWAFPVYNQSERRIQILEITQKTIMNGIMALVKSKKWGDPKGYDITVTRDDSSGKTAYSVMPEPKEALQKEALEEFEKTSINIEALFTGDDPFKSGGETINPEDVLLEKNT